MTENSFPSVLVRREGERVACRVESLTLDDWPEETEPSVVIETRYSSLNYKDALACRGERGVAPVLPHVPGIDCAGRILSSESDTYGPGDEVLITGYGLGAPHWGGCSARVRAPAEWVVPMPAGLDARRAMIYGTAGFTAAQCVMAVTDRVSPNAGEVVVTGATGGVGVFAVSLLTKLGYRVAAITGKPESAALLRGLGAAEVLGREALDDASGKPLLKSRWAAAVDTVGGAPLTTLVKSLSHRGVVAACGLAAGSELPLSVMPFILRGVTLAGIDSAKCPRGPREEVWRRLAGEWRVELPDDLVDEIPLNQVPERAERMLRGASLGRTLVVPVTQDV